MSLPHGLQWVQSSQGQYVPGAVMGGSYKNNIIYVGRVYHEGDLLPGKVNCQYHNIYAPYAGHEVWKNSYEVLAEFEPHQSRIKWIQSRNGEVPFGAIQGGQTSSGEPLYIGRIWHKGEPCVGKIHPSHQTLYISYGGKEHHYKHGYEILCFYNSNAVPSTNSGPGAGAVVAAGVAAAVGGAIVGAAIAEGASGHHHDHHNRGHHHHGHHHRHHHHGHHHHGESIVERIEDAITGHHHHHHHGRGHGRGHHHGRHGHH